MKGERTQVIIRPLVTEKGMTGVYQQNAYPFEVAMGANKAEIRKAVETVFSVRVKAVHTMVRRGKPRRLRSRRGTTRNWKKAVVTLMPGETIEFV